MTYIVIALTILGILEFVTIGLLVYWIYKIEDSIESVKNQSELIASLYKLSHQYEDDLSHKMIEIAGQVDTQTKVCKTLCEIEEKINEQYKGMRSDYDLILDHYSKLLNAWKNIEERYSQSYEQFKNCSDDLKEIKFQVSDLANLSSEDEYALTLDNACDTVCLDCPHEPCIEKDCPVYQIVHRDDAT